jgi:hypothetical protein
MLLMFYFFRSSACQFIGRPTTATFDIGLQFGRISSRIEVRNIKPQIIPVLYVKEIFIN